MRRVVVIVACVLPVLAWGQGAPRTPNLKLKYGGDAAATENFARLDACFGTGSETRDCFGLLRIGRSPNDGTDTSLSVGWTSGDTPQPEHLFSLSTYTPYVGWTEGERYRARVIVENNQDGAPDIDVDFRNTTLNIGCIESSLCSGYGEQIIKMSPSTISSTAPFIVVAQKGQSYTSDKLAYELKNNGAMTQWVGGVTSVAQKVCKATDYSCSTPYYQLAETGTMTWGSGSAATDVSLSRDAVGVVGLAAGQAFRPAAPSNTPPTCSSSITGAVYFDTSLAELCFCNGTNWCKVSSPATCTSNSSCG